MNVANRDRYEDGFGNEKTAHIPARGPQQFTIICGVIARVA